MLKIGVVFGGISAEHEVSLAGANGVLKAFSEIGEYEALPIGISKDGNWVHGPNALKTLVSAADQEMLFIKAEDIEGDIEETQASPSFEYINQCDFVMLLTHGKVGEDGRLQGFFKTLGKPVIGCGVLTSAACFDKALLKSILADKGYSVTPGVEIALEATKITEQLYNDILKQLNIQKLVIKPTDNGSSIGLGFASDYNEFKQAIENASEFTNHVVVEKFIPHKEVIVGIVGQGKDIEVSDVGELGESGDDFLSYEEKYIQYDPVTIPATVNEDVAKKVKSYAIDIYALMKCSGWARIDFFVEDDTNDIYVNEINSIPGMSKPSFFPQVFASKGIDYTSLIKLIVDKAVKAGIQEEVMAMAS